MLEQTYHLTVEPCELRRGDANSDARVNIADAVFTLNAILAGGRAPACADASDADDNGAVDLTDAVFTLDHLFRAGAPIPTPGRNECGLDPTADELGCESSCR